VLRKFVLISSKLIVCTSSALLHQMIHIWVVRWVVIRQSLTKVGISCRHLRTMGVSKGLWFAKVWSFFENSLLLLNTARTD